MSEGYSMEEIHEAMMSQAPTPQSEKKAEVDASKMKSDTQILLAIFEKVVCIEEKLEHKGSMNPVQLPTSLMLEGE